MALNAVQSLPASVYLPPMPIVAPFEAAFESAIDAGILPGVVLLAADETVEFSTGPFPKSQQSD
jgi:hypothetical protein